MDSLVDLGLRSFRGYARWFVHELTHPSLHNYVVLLVLVSAAVMVLERVAPWRRAQRFFRRDCGLDAFYVVFNFFGFGLLGFVAVSDVTASIFARAMASIGVRDLAVVDLVGLPVFVQWLVYFVVRDLIQYGIHRLLHRVPMLWRIHQVHHSVLEMGFAAHLRYHPLETVVYRTLEFLPLALLGFSVTDFFVVHAFALTIGHLNHANFSVPFGPLRYLLNSAEMHILHHARIGPEPRGVNFGITLSIWDYLFGTAWDPSGDRAATPLGFPGIEGYPSGFFGQLVAPFRAAPPEASVEGA